MKYIKFLIVGTMLFAFVAQIQGKNPMQTVNAVISAQPASAETATTVTYKPCQGHQDICEALQRAGFTGEALHIMAAIGHAESSMRINARGDVSLMNQKWEASYGVWQIRCLQNPGTNWTRDKNVVMNNIDKQAQAAWIISGQGKNFYPWSTTHTKDSKGRTITPAYLKYM